MKAVRDGDEERLNTASVLKRAAWLLDDVSLSGYLRVAGRWTNPRYFSRHH